MNAWLCCTDSGTINATLECSAKNCKYCSRFTVRMVFRKVSNSTGISTNIPLGSAYVMCELTSGRSNIVESFRKKELHKETKSDLHPSI